MCIMWTIWWSTLEHLWMKMESKWTTHPHLWATLCTCSTSHNLALCWIIICINIYIIIPYLKIKMVFLLRQICWQPMTAWFLRTNCMSNWEVAMAKAPWNLRISWQIWINQTPVRRQLCSPYSKWRTRATTWGQPWVDTKNSWKNLSRPNCSEIFFLPCWNYKYTKLKTVCHFVV